MTRLCYAFKLTETYQLYPLINTELSADGTFRRQEHQQATSGLPTLSKQIKICKMTGGSMHHL